MNTLRHLIFVAALVFSMAPAHSALAQRAEAFVGVDSVLVGDRFGLTVALGHDNQRTVVFPHQLIPDSLRSQVTFALGDFEILGVRSEGSRPWDGGSVIDSVVYEATTFALDTARVAGVPVSLVAGIDTLTVATDPVFLRVGSLVPAGTEDILDITDISDFPRPIWPWVLLGLLAASALAAWWWWHRRRDEASPLAHAVPATPPVDEALGRLKSLEDMDLRSIEDIKPYYVELADILRTYFGDRAHVQALEATTRELIGQLMSLRADRPVPRDLIRRLNGILDEADLVKFADIRPVVDRTRELLAQSREAIEGTESAYRHEEAQARARAEAEAARAAEDGDDYDDRDDSNANPPGRGDGHVESAPSVTPSDWAPGGRS